MPYETHWEDEGIHWVFSGIVTDDYLPCWNLELCKETLRWNWLLC